MKRKKDETNKQKKQIVCLINIFLFQCVISCDESEFTVVIIFNINSINKCNIIAYLLIKLYS